LERTLIQKDSSSLIKGMLERIITLSALEHKLTQGELKELFVSEVLNNFLPSQFDIGTGVIINHHGWQSNQIDIVIYDNRVLPPFIKKHNIGVYPAESVLATIEVKTWLTKPELKKAEKSAERLHKEIYGSKGFTEANYPLTKKKLKPFCGIIGFKKYGLSELLELKKGRAFLKNEIKYIKLICLTEKYSWARIFNPKTKKPIWNFKEADENTNEEIKRFIAILLDNIRTLSENRHQSLLKNKHRDWLGIYIREQELFDNKKK
jgi:hypothetical protein